MPRHAAPLATSFLLAVTAAAGCTELGERAETGQCPSEPCSDAAPEGLEFAGPTFGNAWLGDRGVKTTAVGGYQNVELIDHASGGPLLVEYQARTISDALSVGTTRGNLVVLHGDEDGATTLRIEDDAGLLDQLRVEAASLAELELVPAAYRVLRADRTRPWLAWTGAEATVVVSLFAADGEPLVDDSLRFLRADGTPWITEAWDVATVTVGAGGIAIPIDAGSLAEPVTLTVAATTAIDEVAGRLLGEAPPRPGIGEFVCFDARSDGADVAFVPWTFTASAGATVRDSILADNCTLLEANTAGTFDVTATAPGGASGTLRVEFVEPTFERARQVTPPAAAGPTLGDRAGA